MPWTPGPTPPVSSACSQRGAAAGFTLIEVMITVAVVAILSVIAYPSYTDYLRRGQVQEAPQNLANLRARMEQYYQDHRSYADGGACGAAVPEAPAAQYFSYSCSTADSGQSYLATAQGAGGLVTGLQYTVDQRNNQATTCSGCAWNFSPQASWVLRKP